MKFIAIGGNDLHKLFETWLVEIYDQSIISVMYLTREG